MVELPVQTLLMAPTQFQPLQSCSQSYSKSLSLISDSFHLGYQSALILLLLILHFLILHLLILLRLVYPMLVPNQHLLGFLKPDP